ncbi:MAG: hypothetical protein UT86_C0003G0077 [Candidatus Magasanikbacteria bacterium GW2011_GWC2_40_17]|uniref:Glycoside hydrolase family 5 domain-containing protein n=1 Tax=Candidatus Magasanikbacteria bacterium GW2011_GWA2_42_32 TaxID=1619039 RepID=A0A0G1A7I0_9BACT|nr:MAG: hypothetical protein UT86_C0003G0077 [Candidatus Magasanikbacteria bacterium GW2011_GWC2_40_17]KKS56980.1 MAG: hypothetical protein UV20_C0004G0076 [Candidatus Magasanikbacteria bacterium GW2011_GWA2_42_32]OGH85708.1 MAG: hypothetical protein A2294_03720 [Candidatus Magasanikbacteria bacterium RIFOXYB2_FULL_38_10]
MKKFLFLILIIIIVLGAILWFWNFGKNQSMEFGVTFSKPQAEYLGLDWQKTYTQILDDLGARRLRLLAYWPEIEKEEGRYDFGSLDWQIKEAKKRQARIILVIGRRLPHWPECHVPEWANKYPENQLQEKILRLEKEIINRYKKESSIIMWQVDNEPLVNWFGTCPPPDPVFVKSEIAFVKANDFRPILITDSGELSFWWRAAHLGGDFFGTTMYRVVWNSLFNNYFEYKYLVPPAFYNLKARVNGLYPASVIIAELQAEPWLREDISKVSLVEQRRSMNALKLEQTASFARRTGFGQAYFWGVEYWYWLKEKKSDDSMWWTAKQIFKEELSK